MKTTDIGIEDPNPTVRTWTCILLDIATNNQWQTQPIGKIKEEINFMKIDTKRRMGGRKEVHPAELSYQVRLNNPQVRLGPGRR